MSSRRKSADVATVAERIDAFRAQAAKVRAHPLFAVNEYTFSFRMRVLASGGSQFLFPAATPDQQHYLASVLRPFMSQEDLPSLGRCFTLFGQVIDDALLRQALSDIRADYLTALKSVLFYSTPSWRQGEPPPTVHYTDREVADAAIYGGGLIHMNAEKRRIHLSLTGPGSDEWENAAVMRQFHLAGTTALRVDDFLRLADEQGALKI